MEPNSTRILVQPIYQINHVHPPPTDTHIKWTTSSVFISINYHQWEQLPYSSIHPPMYSPIILSSPLGCALGEAWLGKVWRVMSVERQQRRVTHCN